MAIMKAKKLIEVALPIKEISAESVRDKSIRHGHISTLHLWWARRPLPTCRAVVFASLVPDPLDENCPQAFKDAVEDILCSKNQDVKKLYKTYPDIPYTAVLDPMEDNPRNRLLMFIGKFSDKCQKNMIAGKSTAPKEQLSDGSLIKWENKNDPKILRRARELIWVAYNAEKNPEVGYETLHKNFNKAYDAITKAEDALYALVDRHLPSKEKDTLEENLKIAIENFQNQMPSVFDPFAGGGAIPLEAARLGCRSYGNDINPVAHIIEKGSAEFPQKYGKPIIYSDSEFMAKYGKEGLQMALEPDRNITRDNDGNLHIPNRLSFDVEYYAKQILFEVKEEVGYLYPKSINGLTPSAYYWARTVVCSNPTCKARIPMLKQFNLSESYYLSPHIKDNNIEFSIQKGHSPIIKGWNNRGNITCPCCGCITSVDKVKEQSIKGGLKPTLLACINENSINGKSYSLPTKEQFEILNKEISNLDIPNECMQRNSNGGDTFTWGITKWGQLFSPRQLHTLNTFAERIRNKCDLMDKSNYSKAILTYLALWFDRIVLINTSFGRLNVKRETLEHPYNRQAIAMVSDYPESNPFCHSSGSALNMLDWIIRYLDTESSLAFGADFNNVSSGEKSQFEKKTITAVVTDPPYYDAIAYADISDFFYIWMKKILGPVFEFNFSTPLTPKTDECTALKHHHNNSETEAKQHFESKLTDIFDSIELQTQDIVSIMFAHQSTEAWTTLCNSILGSRMNITGSWPIDTEMASRTLAIAGAALESSVTVACQPSQRSGFGDFKEVRKAIEQKVTNEVEYLYEMGFRGADLLTACFGQAVSEFGKYETVEKSDGTEVSVAELLEMARNAAFNALLKGVQGDEFTRFYIGWLQLNGTGDTDYDDATKFTRVGVNVDINDIKQKNILILDGKKMHIAMSEERFGNSKTSGTLPEDSLIDQAHRAIILYREGDRGRLLGFIRDIAPEATSPLWRLLATLKELLPANDDQKQIAGLLSNADDLRQHCKEKAKPTQLGLFDDAQ